MLFANLAEYIGMLRINEGITRCISFMIFQAGFLAKKGKFLVGAIDFGTTFSGWAYSFLHDYRLDPTKASFRSWNSGTDTLITEKTPTCVLIAPDGKTLVGFGYEAEDKYQKLVEKGTHRQYYFFKRFKMALDKQVSKNITKS